jgi:polyadenylate-binding protein
MVNGCEQENDGKSKGFGFVNFEKAESALKAVSELNNKEIDGKEIYCGRAQKKSEREAELKARWDSLNKLDVGYWFEGRVSDMAIKVWS